MSSNIKQDVSGEPKDVGSPSQNSGPEQGTTEQQIADASLHTHENGRKNSSLSKREIMEQLSRERFPWDE